MAKVLGLGGLFFKSPDPAKLLAWYAQWLGMGDGKNSIEFSPASLARERLHRLEPVSRQHRLFRALGSSLHVQFDRRRPR